VKKEGEHISTYEHNSKTISTNDLNLLDALLKNSYDYIYYKDKESRFIKLNEKAAWALGAESPDDAIGKSDYDYFPDIAEQTRADELHIMETGKPQLNEIMPIVFADGAQHWVSVSKAPFYDKEGNILGIVGISRDIKKDKEMEIIIKNKTHFLQKILDTSPNCIYVKDKQGRYIIANKTIADLYRTTPDEMIGKKDEDFAHQAVLKPNEASFFKDIDKKAIETKETQIIPSESFTYDDGTTHYFFTTKTPITYQDEPDCVMGISVDISKLKETEKQVSEIENKFQNIFNKSTTGYSLTKLDGTLSEVNKAFASMLGYSVEELTQMNFEDITHPEDVAESKKFVKNLLSGTQDSLRFEKRYYHKNGNIIWTDVSATLMKDGENNPLFFITSIQNITEKKEILKKTQRFFDMSSELIGEADINTATFTKINPAFTRVLGYSEQELLSQSFLEFIHPEDKEPTQNVIDEQLKRGEKVLSFINRYRCKDGSYVWLDWTSSPVPEEGIIYAVARDITEKRKAEEELRNSEQKYRNYIDNAPNGVFICDDAGRYLDVNNKAVETTGYSKDELLHMNLIDFIPNWGKEQGLKHFQTLLKKGQSFGEAPFIHKDGSVRWWQVNAVKLSDERFLGFTQDITKRKIAENELKETRKRLELAMDASEHGFWDWNLDTDEIYFSPRYCTMLGYEPDELPMKLETWVGLMHPDDRKTIVPEVQKHVEHANPYNVEFRLQCKDGSWKWIAGRGKTYEKDSNGIPHRAVGTHVDITERKKVENELRASEEKHRALVEALTDFIFTIDTTGKFMYLNPEFEKITGFSIEEFIGHSFTELLMPEYVESTVNRFKKGLSGEEISVYEIEIKHKSKGKVPIELKVTSLLDADGKTIGRTGVGRDISERKRAEKSVRDSEKKLSQIVHGSAIPTLVIDKDHVVTHWNKALEHLTNHAAMDMIGTSNQWKAFYSEERPIFADLVVDSASIEDIDRYYRGKYQRSPLIENAYRAEDFFPNIGENGSWLDFTVTLLKDSNGKTVGAIETLQDITNKKQSEMQLLQSKKENEQILNTAGDGIRIISKDFKIKMMNDTLAEMTQTSRDNGIGQYCYDVFKSKNCGTEHCSMVKILQTGEGFEDEEIRTNPNGEQIPCMYKATPYRNENDAIIGIIEDFRDISNIKESENRLKDAHEELERLNETLEKKVEDRTQQIQRILEQKDEFVNQLGHDLKNPLGPLLNLLPIVEKKESDPRQREMLHVINRNVQYMKNLVTKTIQLAQLKSPSTGLNYEQIDLRKEIHEVLSNNRLFFNENNINVENLISEPLMIDADKLKLHEVFNNLLNNAVKYNKNEGGTITINQQITDDDITISIQDDGVGMTTEQLEKVFTEFYKADSSRHDFDSSGLGMPICKRIIEMHGGRIWVESEGLGKGSTFYFSLPKKDNRL